MTTQQQRQNKYLSAYVRGLIGMLLFVFAISSLDARAGTDTYSFETPQQEARYRALITEFRCPTCQNQNLASSDALLAQDLKQMTYQLIIQGKTDDDIRKFMVARYGDFISYKPPLNQHTGLLWLFPPVFFMLLLGIWFFKLRQRTDAQELHDTHIDDGGE